MCINFGVKKNDDKGASLKYWSSVLTGHINPARGLTCNTCRKRLGLMTKAGQRQTTIKGEVSPNNNVDWVSRKQFYKPNSKSLNRINRFWIIHLREVIMQNCVKIHTRMSLDGTRPEYVISQEDNSPLTLYIDFHNFQIFLDINRLLLIQFIHKCMHIHLSPNIP